jgi:hypothetical protein
VLTGLEIDGIAAGTAVKAGGGGALKAAARVALGGDGTAAQGEARLAARWASSRRGARGRGKGGAAGALPLYGGARSMAAAAPARAQTPPWPMGLARARLGRAGAGASGLGRASGPAQSGRIVFFFFFLNSFLMRKQFPGKSRNCLKARKILRKSQKFQENS